MNVRTAIGGLLLVAALLTGWLALHHRDKAPVAEGDDATKDYVLHDFQIVALDEQGKESTTLRAPLLERARSDETMTLTTPVFLLPDQDGNHWEMRGDSGWVSAKGDQLKLIGNVSGDSPKVAGVVLTTFRTDHLNVFPKENRARTDARVTMTRPGLSQTGVGFEADMKTRQYKLLSQVKTRYEPNAAR